ncbi:GntR family transcriptional regulator [Siccirubricoccus sp. KC 17139]|uniref:GntR family transcriptional regulator n=1 Tax=Siccirubricoccus soli TaxID=2899147 RepID=A0ABT1DDI2_9PROT|nr:GntR family transcriptional regulator [Siccirubricoccus soli]MCO6419991.1 GntR family transcriptional regulator [Siccirubricoccus soli]MCP2686126.1 GntR family transcriptional regulator [Siccirubricoccus soli]
MLPVQPRTMVEQAAEAIVAAAARGIFLPGDRLVEAEIARDLGISRVPVREALRLLESQGIVSSTPYKGMRLMQVTNAGVAALMRVRLALEVLAVREALAQPGGAERFLGLRDAAAGFSAVVGAPDPALRVAAEEQFHGELCAASGNPPLLALWQSLSRQLAVVWGLGQGINDAPAADREHHALLQALEAGDEAQAVALLSVHIQRNEGQDFEAVTAARRHRGG